MKFSIINAYIVILFILTYSTSFSQDAPTWEYQFEHSYEWGLRDNDANLILAYGDDTFSAYDCKNQKLIWKLNIVGLKMETANRIPNFPLIQFLTESTFKGKSYILINYLTGEVLADTRTLNGFKVTDIHPIYDAERLILKGRKNKEWVFALLHLGNFQPIWIQPLPVKLKLITTRAEFSLPPRKVADQIIFGFADTLWAVKESNGSIQWKRGYQEFQLHSILQKPYYFRTKDPNFYSVNRSPDGFVLNAIASSGKPTIWPKEVFLNTSFNMTGKQNNILYRNNHSFNFISYETGERKWEKPPHFDEKIHKLYQKENGYIVLLENKNQSFISWVNNDGQKQFASPAAIKGNSLRLGRRLNNLLIYLTDLEAGAIDLNTGKKIAESPELASDMIYGFYPDRYSFSFVSGRTVWMFNYKDNTFERITNDLKFKDKEEYITAVRAIPDGWAILSSRNCYRLKKSGEILDHQFYKAESSFNLIKVITFAGSLVAGAVFPDEVMELNRALNNSEIIDSEQAWNNATARAAYGNVGSALVGSSFGVQAYEALYGNKEEKIAAAEFLNNKWIVSDKLGNAQFGLRIINLDNRQESQQIWLHNKSDFNYIILPALHGILYFRDGNRLQFYKIK